MKPLLTILLLLLTQTAFSQQLRVPNATALAADRQGGVYVVTGNGVAKYNNRLELQARHTTTFGRIESVDASDPFRVLVFCRNFHRVFLLDNFLSLLGNPIFLPDVGALQTSAVCHSNENGLWVADGHGRRLLYLDLTLNTTRETTSLAAYQAVAHMVERGGRLFVNFAGENLAVFDRFGALLHLYTVNADGWVDVQGSTLYYLSEKTLYAQDMLSWSTPPRALEHNVELCAIAPNAIYIYRGGIISKILAE